MLWSQPINWGLTVSENTRKTNCPFNKCFLLFHSLVLSQINWLSFRLSFSLSCVLFFSVFKSLTDLNRHLMLIPCHLMAVPQCFYSDSDAAGIRFNGSIQVPLVQSNRLDDELNVLSPTRRIRIRGPQKVVLKSSSSRSTIFASAVNNLYFKSKEKMVSLFIYR